jgi:hypothetical protein
MSLMNPETKIWEVINGQVLTSVASQQRVLADLHDYLIDGF